MLLKSDVVHSVAHIIVMYGEGFKDPYSIYPSLFHLAESLHLTTLTYLS
nr:MAG TPA: hypothetical protein [Caudoviricetes sp.]